MKARLDEISYNAAIVACGKRSWEMALSIFGRPCGSELGFGLRQDAGGADRGGRRELRLHPACLWCAGAVGESPGALPAATPLRRRRFAACHGHATEMSEAFQTFQGALRSWQAGSQPDPLQLLDHRL